MRNDPSRSAERALVDALAAGEEDALRRAYDLYGGLVFSVARRVTGSDEEAEDVLQDVFLHLWRRATTFDADRGTLAAFLVTMSRNRSIDRLRSRSARPDGAGAPLPDGSPASEPSPLDQAAGADAGARVRAALSTLPAEERRALELAYWRGLTQTQIAEETGTPLGTVKGRVRNGLRRLRDLLPSDWSEGLEVAS